VRSYLHWSFQDNFEWAEGFRQKFGLVAMEDGTRNRMPRPSAFMFRDIAKANAVPAALLERYL
jgi:beta-glucosidase/6-phospho-beta-glucosidase/beta-galactosidase